MLATVTGALQRWLSRTLQGPLPLSLRAFCPVDLRERGKGASPGNHISPWLVPLPMSEPDALDRLAAIHVATQAMKRRRAQRGGDAMARVIEWLGPWVARLGMAIASRRGAFNIVVTNVSGPRPLELLGARLTRLVAFAPLFPGQRVSVAVVRYGGQLSWGVTEVWIGPQRGQRFAADLAAELAELSAACAAGGEAA